MLSGCQNASIQKMVTKRHDIASRIIINTLSKGEFGGFTILTGIRTSDAPTKPGFAGTCSQQDSTPMASTQVFTKPFSR